MDDIKTAYVVDDRVGNREMHTRDMEAAGYAVTTFDTVDAALEHMDFDAEAYCVNERLPSVMITDNNTHSDYNGVNLAKALDNSHVGCVVVSGTDVSAKANKFHAAFLLKHTYSPDGLAEAAKQVQTDVLLRKSGIEQKSTGMSLDSKL